MQAVSKSKEKLFIGGTNDNWIYYFVRCNYGACFGCSNLWRNRLFQMQGEIRKQLNAKKDIPWSRGIFIAYSTLYCFLFAFSLYPDVRDDYRV